MAIPKMRMSTQDLAERLDQHPELRVRLEAMLSVVEDEAGDCRLAEERLVEEMRRMRQAALQGWAQRQVERAEQEIGQYGQVHREGKKLRWHTSFGDIEVMEPQYRRLSLRIRPFAHSAMVNSRDCSRRLQRIVTDFGADLPFAQVMDKLVEHYGIVISESSIRRITLGQAQALFELTPQSQQWPTQSSCKVIIAQTDGGSPCQTSCRPIMIADDPHRSAIDDKNLSCN